MSIFRLMRLRLSIGLSLFLALNACVINNTSERLLADYVQRVENATGMNAQTSRSSTVLLAYPTQRLLKLPMDDMRISVADYMGLRHCRLFNLVSERNSLLGKVMPLSQQLVYEIEFLREAAICRQRLKTDSKGDKPTDQALLEMIQAKRKTFPIVFWNATFASPEMAKVFSQAADALPLDENNTHIDSRQAIDYLINLGEQAPQFATKPDIAELEEQYFALQLHRYGGRLLKSVAELSDTLNRAADALERMMEKGPVCRQNKPIKKARILKNVFSKYYVGTVQRHLSRIDRQGQQWLEAIEHFVRIQQVELPPAFANYRARMLALDGKLWQGFRNATKRHTLAWKSLFDQCGLLPQTE
ncbi:MAG: DUF3080 domain-containing protein [Candidatus Competibacteraceae bacterium]|nr:DUF3080 domain-containing protein [Candidatus Competibacteraceae bacterium]